MLLHTHTLTVPICSPDKQKDSSVKEKSVSKAILFRSSVYPSWTPFIFSQLLSSHKQTVGILIVELDDIGQLVRLDAEVERVRVLDLVADSVDREC